ncbi:hypothetical protein ABB02_01302 [Clostridiaceae bacterium JG1575]|nr:hypothetical protein ABB02_01302 [Clostridiaceae bacterium JG1575]
MNQQLWDRATCLAHLKKDLLRTLDSVDLLERGMVEVALAREGVMVLAGSPMFQVHLEDPEALPEVVALLRRKMPENDFCFVRAHESFYAKDLADALGFPHLKAYYNALYPADLPVPQTLRPGLSIAPLSMEHFAFIRATYHTVDDDEYIRERLEEGMLGAFLEGELVGFVGTHEEGSIGLLEVLPPYRRMGIASALNGAMVTKLRALGRRTYGTIEATNETSLIAHRTMGVQIAKDPVYWLFR